MIALRPPLRQRVVHAAVAAHARVLTHVRHSRAPVRADVVEQCCMMPARVRERRRVPEQPVERVEIAWDERINGALRLFPAFA